MKNFLKKIQTRSVCILAGSGFLTIIFLVFLVISLPFLTGVIQQSPDGHKQAVTLPHRGNSASGALFVFRGTFKRKFYTQTYVNIIPDDRVEWMRVNGQAVDLSSVSNSKISDWKYGFNFDLKPYLQPGNNKIEIAVRNNGGKYGLAFFPSGKSGILIFVSILILLNFMVFLFVLLKKTLSWDTVLTALVVAGILLRFIVMFYTHYTVRSYDVAGHLEYIWFILKHFFPPAKHAGWMFYHPPFYYFLAAGAVRIGLLFTQDKEVIYKLLQFFSLLLNAGFLIATVEIFKRIFGSRSGRKIAPIWIATVVFVFWPGGVIHAVRIGNDGLQYLFSALSLLFFVRWRQEDSRKAFYLSFVFAAFGMITKTNAILLFGLLGIYYLIDLIRTKAVVSRWRELVVLGLTTLVVLMIGFRVPIKNFSGGLEMVSNASTLTRQLKVGNRAQNYLYFDLKTYINTPFVSPWKDETGRQYFWNYLLKTSLFGEFSEPDAHLGNQAVVLSWVALLMVLYTLAGMVLQNRKWIEKNQVVLSYFVILILGAIVFRILYPYASSNDFRYTLPILIPFSIFFAQAIVFFRFTGRKRIEWFGYILTVFLMVWSWLYLIRLGFVNI